MKEYKLFSKIEMAFILGEYVKVRSGIKEKNDAANTLSHILRFKARQQGYEIDDSFRSSRGIISQFSMIESALAGHRAPTTVLREIIDLYIDKRSEYNKLLEDANSYFLDNDISLPIFKTFINQKFFIDGINIPIEYTDLVLECYGIKYIFKGLKKKVDIIINDESYEAELFECSSTKEKRKSIQLKLVFNDYYKTKNKIIEIFNKTIKLSPKDGFNYIGKNEYIELIVHSNYKIELKCYPSKEIKHSESLYNRNGQTIIKKNKDFVNHDDRNNTRKDRLVENQKQETEIEDIECTQDGLYNLQRRIANLNEKLAEIEIRVMKIIK